MNQCLHILCLNLGVEMLHCRVDVLIFNPLGNYQQIMVNKYMVCSFYLKHRVTERETYMCMHTLTYTYIHTACLLVHFPDKQDCIKLRQEARSFIGHVSGRHSDTWNILFCLFWAIRELHRKWSIWDQNLLGYRKLSPLIQNAAHPHQ